jgi:hypothetical protein
MKKIVLGLAALGAVAGLSAPAMAQPFHDHRAPPRHRTVVVKPHWVNVCHTEYRHHHRVRVCHRVRR